LTTIPSRSITEADYYHPQFYFFYAGRIFSILQKELDAIEAYIVKYKLHSIAGQYRFNLRWLRGRNRLFLKGAPSIFKMPDCRTFLRLIFRSGEGHLDIYVCDSFT